MWLMLLATERPCLLGFLDITWVEKCLSFSLLLVDCGFLACSLGPFERPLCAPFSSRNNRTFVLILVDILLIYYYILIFVYCQPSLLSSFCKFYAFNCNTWSVQGFLVLSARSFLVSPWHIRGTVYTAWCLQHKGKIVLNSWHLAWNKHTKSLERPWRIFQS